MNSLNLIPTEKKSNQMAIAFWKFKFAFKKFSFNKNTE